MFYIAFVLLLSILLCFWSYSCRYSFSTFCLMSIKNVCKKCLFEYILIWRFHVEACKVDKCLVYPLTCNCCKKQHVGQTVDKFRFRWNNCKSNCRKHQHGKTCMKQNLYEHFCSSNHNCLISDVSVTFIDETDPSVPLKKGDYWRSTLKTMAPFGHNVEESVGRSVFCTLAALDLQRQSSTIRFFKLLAGHCHNLNICMF